MEIMNAVCMMMWGMCAILNGYVAYRKGSAAYVFVTILDIICCILFAYRTFA